MNNERQKIIDKVIKLLALSEGTNHGPEAEAAKNMAAELMAKYDISIAESKEPPEYITREDELNRKTPRTWDEDLLHTVAQFNGVALVRRKRAFSNVIMVLIGRAVDLEAHDYMMDIILQQRKASWKKYTKDFKYRHFISPKSNDRRAWHNGFTLGISAKLRELTRMKKNKVEEKGLVPVDQSLQAMNHFEDENGACRTRGTRDRTSNWEGFEAGKNTSIHKGIETSGKTLLIS